MGPNSCEAPILLLTLLSGLAILRPTLTRPGCANLRVLFAGWVQTAGLHAVTETLVATDVARRHHHERFHRFFSRGSWSPDQWGKILFFVALRLVPDGAAICVAQQYGQRCQARPRIAGTLGAAGSSSGATTSRRAGRSLLAVLLAI